jgi:ADP-ribose pyrophosphatase
MPQELNSSSEANRPNETVVYRGFVSVVEKTLATPHGPYQYVTVHAPSSSVLILPVCDDGRWIVTREYRHAVDETVLSFPGGLIDKGEDPILAARRELLEETGYTAKVFELIGHFFPLPGLLRQTVFVIVARHASQVQPQNTGPCETISCELHPPEAIGSLFSSSSHVDAMALAGLALFWAKSSSQHAVAPFP